MATAIQKQAVLGGKGGCGSARGQSQLGEDIGDVAMHRVLATAKAGCYLPVGQTLGIEHQDFDFPPSQAMKGDRPSSLRGTAELTRKRCALPAACAAPSSSRSGRPLVFPRLPQRRVPRGEGATELDARPGRLEGAPLRANSPTAPSKCAFAASGSDMVATRPSARRSAACIAPVDTFKTTAHNCCRAASASCLSPSST